MRSLYKEETSQMRLKAVKQVTEMIYEEIRKQNISLDTFCKSTQINLLRQGPIFSLKTLCQIAYILGKEIEITLK